LAKSAIAGQLGMDVNLEKFQAIVQEKILLITQKVRED